MYLFNSIYCFIRPEHASMKYVQKGSEYRAQELKKGSQQGMAMSYSSTMKITYKIYRM